MICEDSDFSHHTLYMGNLVPVYFPAGKKKQRVTTPIFQPTDDQKQETFLEA